MAQFVLLRMSFVLGIMLLSFAGTTVMDEVVVTTGGTGVLALLPALFAIIFQIGAVYEHKEQTKKNRGSDRYENL
jgi:hypothetical protein